GGAATRSAARASSSPAIIAGGRGRGVQPERAPRRVARLQRLVRTVAQRLVAAVLAAAEIHGLRRVGLVLDRRERRRLVRAVAERLPLALAARARAVGLGGLDRERKGAQR